MSAIKQSRARAVADVAAGEIVASVEIAVAPERVFQALASKEIVEWWVRLGVFDTREWSGDVRAGGRWRTSGIARGQPFVLEGEYLEVDPPRKLVHTWQRAGAPIAPSTVTYFLERIEGGTRLTLRHTGIAGAEACANMAAGWEASFDRLGEVLP